VPAVNRRKKLLIAVATAAAATIAHGDLTALLYLQGYRKAEIAQR
jgi:Putative ATPase subunit of terminase (gpP-like)